MVPCYAICSAPEQRNSSLPIACAGDEDWWGKHRITIGEKMPEDLSKSYSEAQVGCWG